MLELPKYKIKMIKTRCLWDRPETSDGYRILITRFWPRGKKKDIVDMWDPDLGPNKELLLSYKTGKVAWQLYDETEKKDNWNGERRQFKD